MSRHEMLPKSPSSDEQSLEEFFTERIARKYDIDPSAVTPHVLEMIEHEVEFDSRPPAGSIPRGLNFLTQREILERRARVESLLAETAIES